MQRTFENPTKVIGRAAGGPADRSLASARVSVAWQAAQHRSASVAGTRGGAPLDETLAQRYAAFEDPDRIAWELYMECGGGPRAAGRLLSRTWW